MSRRADFFCIHGAHTEDRASVEACLRREKGRQGNKPAFFINQHFLSADDDSVVDGSSQDWKAPGITRATYPQPVRQ